MSRSGPYDRRSTLTGFIVIRLYPAARDNDSDDLIALTRSFGLSELHRFLVKHSTLKPVRAIQRTPPKALRELEDRSKDSDLPYVNSVTLYWRLDARSYLNPGSGPDTEDLREELSLMHGEVDIAYHDYRVSNASPDGMGTCVSYLSEQRYLNKAPEGIDAHFAWTRCRGKGQRVRVIDLESGWNLDHVDLPGPQLLFGDNSGEWGHPDSANHGTQTLGVIGAIENGCGVTGIAPRLQSLDVVSHYVRESPFDPTVEEDSRFFNVSDAIDAAIWNLNAGDILVIEFDRDPDTWPKLPTEIMPLDADQIRLAYNQHITVVEAAGNGYSDLAKWHNTDGEHTLDPSKPSEFFRSGAIIVGACRSAVSGVPPNEGHVRASISNYGERVDCHAWGQGVRTTSGSVGENDSYTYDFSRTSSATAIIGGAAAVVQSWYRAVGGCPLKPRQMRALFRDPENGTPQVDIASPPEPIGAMPDLRKIMTWRTRITQLIRCIRSKFKSGRRNHAREDRPRTDLAPDR